MESRAAFQVVSGKNVQCSVMSTIPAVAPGTCRPAADIHRNLAGIWHQEGLEQITILKHNRNGERTWLEEPN